MRSSPEDGQMIWRMKEGAQRWRELTMQADPVVYRQLTQAFLRSLTDGVFDDTVRFPLRVSLRAYREPGMDAFGTETACWLPDPASGADQDTQTFTQSMLQVFEGAMARVKNYCLGFKPDEVLIVNGMRRYVCRHLASHIEVQSALGVAIREATIVLRQTYLGTSDGRQALGRLLSTGTVV